MEELAKTIIDGLLGPDNITNCTVCMTRLRFTCKSADIHRASIENLEGVLGVVIRDDTHIDIVLSFGLVSDTFYSICTILGDKVATQDYLPPRSVNSMHVQISPGKRRSYAAQAQAHFHPDSLEDLSALLTMLDTEDGESCNLEHAKKKHIPHKLLVINGPCLSMLGVRQPEIYGYATYENLVAACKVAARQYGFDTCYCIQTNSESKIIDAILDAYDKYDALVINPAAYTHTSLAILDALLTVNIPFAEVHISNPETREPYRHFSYLKDAAQVRVLGKGVAGYEEAIKKLAELLQFSPR